MLLNTILLYLSIKGPFADTQQFCGFFCDYKNSKGRLPKPAQKQYLKQRLSKKGTIKYLLAPIRAVLLFQLQLLTEPSPPCGKA